MQEAHTLRTGAAQMQAECGWCRFTNVDGLRQGKTTQTMDLSTVIYRMKMLGFNAIRLPMTFDNHWGLGQVEHRSPAACSC